MTVQLRYAHRLGATLHRFLLVSRTAGALRGRQCPAAVEAAQIVLLSCLAVAVTTLAHGADQEDAGLSPLAYLIAFIPILASLITYWLPPASRWVTSQLLANKLLGRPLSKFLGRRYLTFKEAKAATLAVPLVDGIDLKEGIVCIAAGDGYIGGKGKGPEILKEAVSKWTRNGLIVRYLLFRPSDDTVDELSDLQREVGESLEIYVLKGKVPKGIRGIAHVLETYHPNLVRGKNHRGEDKRAMWIEGNHPRQTDVSYDNEWVPPGAMKRPAKRVPSDPDGKQVTWGDLFDMWDEEFKSLLPRMKRIQVCDKASL